MEFNLKGFPKVIDKIPKYVNTGEIIELGCGEGRILFRLSQLGDYSFTGVDVNKKNLAKLYQLFESEKIKIKVLEKDIINLKLKECFDVVILSFVMHLLKDKLDCLDVLEIMSSITKNGGINVFLLLHNNLYKEECSVNEFISSTEIKNWYINTKKWEILEEEHFNVSLKRNVECINPATFLLFRKIRN